MLQRPNPGLAVLGLSSKLLPASLMSHKPVS